MGDKGFTASELESRDDRNTSVNNFPFQDSTSSYRRRELSELMELQKPCPDPDRALSIHSIPDLYSLSHMAQSSSIFTDSVDSANSAVQWVRL
ncbi:hypothetical protein F2Q68_00024641 [Brassica cretica]|uniref:Uncharacterized protein n=1 Tax=Brassica cretica TaxID=69181 RepID=A0A8S9II46_BRACR|nr:hypothetical protein F2Q68_00024641 [Brassica cretica]